MHIQSRIGRSKPAPHRMQRGASRVVVRSIGNSGVGMVRSLRRVVPLPEPDLAALLFQAPSELLTGLDRSTADLIAGTLRETGLDCAVLDADTAMEEGVGDHEIALHIHDFARMLPIVLEVMCVLGIDERSARKLVCTVPTVLLGGVSSATVKALRTRFTPLGAGIDASRPETARFDVFLDKCPTPLREHTIARLQAVTGIACTQVGARVMNDLDRDSMDRAWHELRQLSVPGRFVNRDFARYALTLEQAPDTPALRRYLTQRAGIAEASITELFEQLPVVVQHGLKYEDAKAALAELAAVGAEGSSQPVAFQQFALVLSSMRDPAALVPVLRELGEFAELDASELLREPTPRVPGPFTATHARWLAHELRRAGANVQLECLEC